MLVCSRSGMGCVEPLHTADIQYIACMHDLSSRALRVISVCMGKDVAVAARVVRATSSQSPPVSGPVAPGSAAGTRLPVAVSHDAASVGSASISTVSSSGYSGFSRVTVAWPIGSVMGISLATAPGIALAFGEFERDNAVASLRQFVRNGDPHPPSNEWYAPFMHRNVDEPAKHPARVPLTNTTVERLLCRVWVASDTIACSTIAGCLYGVYGRGAARVWGRLDRLCSFLDGQHGVPAVVTRGAPVQYTVRAILAAFSIFLCAHPDAQEIL